MKDLSLRAQMVTRRTYNRPLDEAGTVFETWKETVSRVVHHQVWLWERQLGRKLNIIEAAELEELRTLMEERKALLSGRTLWLGGTDTAKAREASQFNCAFTHVETVYDVVDVLWLLLQGCGVGFRPIVGTLNGFGKRIRVRLPATAARSAGRTLPGGNGGISLANGVSDLLFILLFVFVCRIHIRIHFKVRVKIRMTKNDKGNTSKRYKL